ncbi:MAG: hypothetical protein U0744_08500 [Gemmataceae bacterium]
MSNDPTSPPKTGFPWAIVLIVGALLLMVGGIIVALNLPAPKLDK